MSDQPTLKSEVRDFWDEMSCGEIYATGESEIEFYESQSRTRYELEPCIHEFAKFSEGHNKDILEIGVGMGADHVEWARSSPKSLTGIDLTPRAVDHTHKRLSLLGLESNLSSGDAEELPFDDNSFDIVYSWGVLHHSPQTPVAVNEVYRVLRPGGVSRVMIYHKYALTGYMLWVRYALMRGTPFMSLSDIYSSHLESPGTKAYSKKEAKSLFSCYSDIHIDVRLSAGDLLLGEAGQRHRGIGLTVAKALWPRRAIRALFRHHGLFLLIEARKSI